MMKEAAYTPIACHLYDELEIVAMRRKTVEVVFQDELSHPPVEAKISDLWARDGVEYLKLSTGETFRLDQIQSVDGQSFFTETGEQHSCNIRPGS